MDMKSVETNMESERQRIILELELLNIEKQLAILKSLQRRCKDKKERAARKRRLAPPRPPRKKKIEKIRKRLRRWSMKPERLARPEEGEYCFVSKALTDKDNEKLFEYFHMTADTFLDLVGRIHPFIRHQNTHIMPIDIRQRLAITLRILATGGMQKSVAEAYKLGPSTVHCIVREVCKALWTALQPDFLPCPSAEIWKVIQSDFWQQWSFPNCVGSLDGKLVNVKTPKRGQFKNKLPPPLALVATCDAKYRFTMVNVETFQPENDGDIFMSSTLGSQLLDGKLDLPPPVSLSENEAPTPSVFVADASFPLHNNCMRPIQGINLSMEKQAYNFQHSRVMRVMENTFGILVARWRVLSRLEYGPDKCISILKTAIVLHNFLACTDDSNPPGLKYIPADFADTSDALGSIQPGQWRTIVAGDTTNIFDPLGPQRLPRTPSRWDGASVRNRLMKFFHSFNEDFSL